MISLIAAVAAFPDRPFQSPTPEVSGAALASTVAALDELSTKVKARPDAECFPSGYLVTACFIEGRTGVYQFTDDGHAAHPAAFYRGYHTQESGRRRLEERSWFAADKEAADAFFARGKESMVQPLSSATD